MSKSTINQRLTSFLNHLKEERKVYNDTDFAQKIGVGKNFLSDMKNGNKPVSEKSVQKIHFYFPSLNSEWLLTGEGEMLKNEAITNSNGNIFTETDTGYVIKCEMIPFEAYASYIEAYNDEGALEGFDMVSFNVDKVGRGNYKGFKIKGDSMNGGGINDTPDGAQVLARELGRQHWKDGFRASQYGWIILSTTNIFHKDIIALNKETGTISCHSRNTSPEYADFELNLNEVYQIFKVIKRTF